MQAVTANELEKAAKLEQPIDSVGGNGLILILRNGFMSHLK
jgi:hypothetical protein